MKLRRKIYEGLIAQCESLAAALHEEKSKRQLWTRKYYTLLLGIESARREAGNGGKDAAATRFGSDTNGEPNANGPNSQVGISPAFGRKVMLAPAWWSDDPSSTVAEYLHREYEKIFAKPGYDPDGFYTSHSLNTLEAFGALPCRTVANAYCDAPFTVALTTELTRPVLSGGDECSTSPLPPVEPVCDAFLRNAREPLSPDSTTIINSAV